MKIGSKRRIASLVVTLALSLGVPTIGFSQAAAPPGFQAYRLENVRLDDASVQLQKLLADSQLAGEVLLDRQQGRLLLRGPEAAQRLAAQLLQAIDKPGPATASGPHQDPVLQGYRVEASELESVKNRLEARFPLRSGVRISADPRTNQLLVLAPLAAHQQIAAELQVDAPGAENAPPRREFTLPPAAEQGAPAQAAASVAIPHKLKHLAWNELENGLSAILAGRSQMTAAPQGQVSLWRVRVAPEREIGLTIDRTGGEVTFRGAPADVMAARRLIAAMDQPRSTGAQQTRILPVQPAAADASQEAAKVVRWASQFSDPARDAAGNLVPAGNAAEGQPVERRIRWGGDLVARLFQPAEGAQPEAAQPEAAQPAPEAQPPVAPGGQLPPDAPDAPVNPGEGGLIGPVQIEFVEGLDVIILRGNKRDVDRVAALIAEIERLTEATEPVIEVFQIKHVGSEQMAEVVSQVYDQVLAPRTGPVSIVPLVKPNAILLVGREDSVGAVKKFIEKLDQPTPPAAEFAVIRLKHMPAQSAQTILTEYFSSQQAQAAPGVGVGGGAVRQNLGTRAKVVADYRTNSVIVFAGPRDLLEVEKLIARLDVVDIGTTNEVKVFKLKNSIAEELQPVLEEAILGSAAGVAGGIGVPQGGAGVSTQRSRQLQLDMMIIDAVNGGEVTSGVLADVSISADPRSNALIVTAPAESMGLIEALIKELDKLPTPEALIKVFTIANGDATSMAEMLREMFGLSQTTAGGGGGFGGAGGGTAQVPVQTATGQGDSSLVGMRFSVDERTNSIIASGTAGDLEVVEVILLRLDSVNTSQQRQTTVYQLNNAPAQSVADAFTQLLANQRTIVQQTEQQASLLPPLLQVEREIIVIPEPISNSLLISATSRYFDQVLEVVKELDRRPPMVRIDVLIAEVALDDFHEVGFEFGLQDSLLFDRGIGTQTGGVNPVGFPFNNLPLGNNTGVNPTAIGTQGLSSFGLGRMSPTAGFGGLVFSASSESVNVLVRALQQRGKLQVLSRPQITTVDNIPGSVLVGQIVSRIQGTTVNAATTTQNVADVNVGLLLDVTPRVAPDGLVTMAINVQKSALSSEGVPIPTGDGGVVISPNINTTEAETTASARSGQTLVLSGLITKEKMVNTRGVPVISDLPFIGPFFRFDTKAEMRTELLIIMTPTIIEDDQDIEWLKQTESERMNWCLADVIEIYGDKGLVGVNQGLWNQRETPVIFPHDNPSLENWQAPNETATSQLNQPQAAGVSEEVPPEVREARHMQQSHRNAAETRSILVPPRDTPLREVDRGEGPLLAPANEPVQPAGYYPPWQGR